MGRDNRYRVESNSLNSAPHTRFRPGRTPWSIAAGYLGLFSLVIFPLAPFAIGFGIWALVRSKRRGPSLPVEDGA